MVHLVEGLVVVAAVELGQERLVVEELVDRPVVVAGLVLELVVVGLVLELVVAGLGRELAGLDYKLAGLGLVVVAVVVDKLVAGPGLVVVDIVVGQVVVDIAVVGPVEGLVGLHVAVEGLADFVGIVVGLVVGVVVVDVLGLVVDIAVVAKIRIKHDIFYQKSSKYLFLPNKKFAKIFARGKFKNSATGVHY